MSITFAIIKERKNPPDRRVVFSPPMCQQVIQQFPEATIMVEASDIRVFSDQAYRDAGCKVTADVTAADVMLGVKEVPVEALIPHKKYFFFSHTIKKQPYNRELLKAVIDKKITLYDHETITAQNGNRLIGFGRYAGLVGAYNGFRALGLRDELYQLPKVERLTDLEAVKKALDTIQLPSQLKIVLTGKGKVAYGAKEILDYLNIKQVDVEEYLSQKHDHPVYCMIDVMDYNKLKNGAEGVKSDFYKDPSVYQSNFMRFAKVSTMFIAGHFYGEGAPLLITAEDAQHPDFNINLIADISCDIAGPIASTIRPSTIANPFYGYDPVTRSETDFKDPNAITVMAVDNLPCELPKDASEGFGEMFLQHVIPAFFNNDKDGVLERAQMTTPQGTLTPRFAYLQSYIEGN